MTHTDSFDSRALRYTDAYGQRFMREGTYRYHLGKAGSGRLGEHATYTIRVEGGEKNHKMRQHTILVLHKDGGFEPDDPEIAIQAGDLVMWACRQAAAPAFEVVGSKDFFGSASLVNECGYAHAFSAPGDYEWTDANGGKAHGVVHVRDPKCRNQKEIDKWQKKLGKGALVMITDEKVEPGELEIVTGQTVYFAVVKSGGISITDRRVAEVSRQINQAVEKLTGCSG